MQYDAIYCQKGDLNQLFANVKDEIFAVTSKPPGLITPQCGTIEITGNFNEGASDIIKKTIIVYYATGNMTRNISIVWDSTQNKFKITRT